jgi:hypothetical protein
MCSEENWRAAAKINTGPLFRVMNRHGHVVDKRLWEIITKGNQVKVLSETLLDFRLQYQSLPARH